MKVEKGCTKLNVSCEGREVLFMYPPVIGNHYNILEQFKSFQGFYLRKPSSSEISSLVDEAWKNPKGNYENEIIGFEYGYSLQDFTKSLYLPRSKDEINNGVILFDNREENFPDKGFLANKLLEGDPKFRFVPFGFKVGEQSIKELETNSYIVSKYGEEGASKIARVASKYGLHAYLDIPSSVGGVGYSQGTSLNKFLNCGESQLKISPCGHDEYGYSFGVISNKG